MKGPLGVRTGQVSPGVKQRVVQAKQMRYIYYEEIEDQVEDERLNDAKVGEGTLIGEQAFD